MEKISRILPPSRRVVAVDTEQSQPVRPGAPDFSRPRDQRVSIQDRVSFSATPQGPRDVPAPGTYKNPKESARAKIVDELAEKFFNPAAVAKEEGESVQSEEILKRLNTKENFNQVVD